jgi:hypothetical protein
MFAARQAAFAEGWQLSPGLGVASTTYWLYEYADARMRRGARRRGREPIACRRGHIPNPIPVGVACGFGLLFQEFLAKRGVNR